jgi:hypothetical protein
MIRNNPFFLPVSQLHSAVPAPFWVAVRLACLVAVMICMMLQISPAQVSTGTVSGTVQDPSGAVVPGATVTLTSVQTADVSTAVTNGEGVFTFRSVPAATYNLTAEFSGFAPYKLNGVVVSVSQALNLSMKLQLAGTQSTVTVEANPLAVDTQTSSVQTVINELAIAELPLEGRDASKLVFTVPGVVDPTSKPMIAAIDSVRSSANYPNSTAVTTNGTRVGGTYFALDGATNTDPMQLTGGPFPNPDATGEFSV